MRKTTAALLATLALAAPLGVAQATGVAVTIATPHFGLQFGAPVYAPPIYAQPVYAPPVRVYAPPPRYFAYPAPVYPVAYPYVVLPAKARHHRHFGPAYRGPVPVVAVAHRRH